MAWNEPGGSNKDPWGGGGRNQGPPDLDEVIRKLSDKFGGLFGGKRGGGGGAGPQRPGITGIGIILAIVVIGWFLSGIYIVDEGTRGVVLRFGRYVDTTMPGPHWHIPFPVERVEIVNVEQVRVEEIGYRSGGGRQPVTRSVPREALMLTQDENIVDIRLAVQYQVKDPQAYLFNVQDPDLTLRQVIESAAREAVGKSTMDFVLTEGRAEIVAQVKSLGQDVLDQYGAGLQLITVNLQDAQPPEEVQPAFAEAIRAREDEQRLINEAQAYANEIIPKARGQAARRLEEAEAYREEITAEAEGEASRFTQLLTEYLKAPVVTRERLYLETIQSVLANASKVLVDVEGGNNLFYLPLDKFMRQSSRDGEQAAGSARAGQGLSMPTSDTDLTTRFRETSRSRETR